MLLRSWICLLIFPYMAASASANSMSVSQIQETGKVLFRALRDSECKVKCKSRRPRIMCGSDGVSYHSKCEVKRARRCEGKNVVIRWKGKCADEDVPMTKCFQEREEAMTSVSKGDVKNVFIPECNADGTYAEVQCHSASGFCWCVESDGKPFPRTSTKDDRPNCKDKQKRNPRPPKPPKLPDNGGKPGRKKPPKPEKNKSKRCSSHERKKFNSNLVRVFTEEYNRSVKAFPNTRPNELDPLMEPLEKQVVEWKFSHYDSNNDDLLQRKEVSALRRLVKKFIKPRSCAKRFLKFCDKDKDKLIKRQEWSICLGVDINISFRLFVSLNSDDQDKTTHAPEVKTTGESLDLNKLLTKKSSSSSSSSSSNNGEIERPAFPSLPINVDKTWTEAIRPTPIKEPRPNKQANDCRTDRESALEQEKDNPKAGIFVPKCTPEGKWSRAQCHDATGYCWCVEENSGRPITGTSTHGEHPKCDFDAERNIPGSVSIGCSYAEKQNFLADLLATLTQEMAQYALNNRTDHSALVVDPNQTVHERAVHWKFNVLDTNKNQDLENSELEIFRETLKSAQKKATRKCARKFVRFCDEDGNKKVSKQEWVDCMGITRNISIKLPSHPKRTGQNPFDQYLRDT
ncbi:SPARC-related modular calcium-binding protein 1-like isoform X2 [Ruditapes philippinarum]|uniref:SPARC-related modular calcium-binding protein 1-like isoform X2 n=1 Tax=Ruditapes philippinarum TaxID=129788 RepID=UPI00295B7B08|nr:SPARC-related modular calcium-binding protein 1-like isoform X2 [Ruditapes philippinarum]